MNDDLNNIFNGSLNNGHESPKESEENKTADQSVNRYEKEPNFTDDSDLSSLYERKLPSTEGEYHFGREQQYSEKKPETQQQSSYNNDIYNTYNTYNNGYKQQNNSTPFGTGNNYSNEQNHFEQPKHNPYSQNSEPQNRNPYSQNSEPQNRNPYSQNYDQQNRNVYYENSCEPNRNPYSENAGGQNRNPYSVNGYPYGDASNNNYAYPDSAPEKKKKGGKVFIGILAAIFVFALTCVVALTVLSLKSTTPPENTSNSPTGEVIDNVDEAVTSSSPVVDTSVDADGILSPTQIYQKVLPSSVGVLVYSNSSKSLASEGSGIIISEDNDGKYTYILTCAHVISGSGQNIMVQLFNEKEYRATIVGYDSKTDIGVIRIEASGLQKLEIGDSKSLSVGETIYAIGNPGGTEFANTFTNGIVTALDRPVASSATGYTMECIQHNAAINPGNSGGALVNQYGQLIGINSMKIVASEYEGMGFAVPSSVFVGVMNDIVVNGYVTNRPKIGISYVKASAEQAYAMFVAIKGLPSGSIVIASVAEDSDFYGKIESGDLVTAMNGKNLDSSADLAASIEGMNVGDKITLDVVRINSDYSFREFSVTGVLVEDKETVEEEEESNTSIFDDYFGDSYGSYDDYFDDFFGGYFGNP